MIKKSPVPLLLAWRTVLVQESEHSMHGVRTAAGSGTNWPVGQVRLGFRPALILWGNLFRSASPRAGSRTIKSWENLLEWYRLWGRVLQSCSRPILIEKNGPRTKKDPAPKTRRRVSNVLTSNKL